MSSGVWNLEAARDAAEKAIEIWTTPLGPDHENIAAAMLGLAALQTAEGDLDAALQTQTQALAKWRDAGSHHELENYAAARDLYLLASALLPDDHHVQPLMLASRGVLAADEGDDERAVQLLDAALRWGIDDGSELQTRAEARFHLASALHRLRRDSPRVAELVRQAKTDVAGLPVRPPFAAKLDQLALRLERK